MRALRALCGAAIVTVILPAAAAAQNQVVASDTKGGTTTMPVSTPPSSNPEHATLAPKASATRLTGTIKMDGVLDEAIWQTAPAITDLHQIRPTEGAAPTFRTEVRIAYDEENLYVGARMFDNEPDKIVARLARRDGETGSDFILIQFDPYHDHNGDASFSLNAAGMRWDGGNGDVSWDPVWVGEVQIDSLGWTAEMRIPFSQLRFRPGSTEPWGFQIERFVNRINETSMFSFWRQNESGGPSRWGHLEGVANPTKVPGRLELLPYVVTQADKHDVQNANNPFEDEFSSTLRVGADFKYQLTSTLTLSATVNPDFGQAEIDPAVVNLSAFETVFDEKREFFIEGRDKFRFGSLWCFTCSNTSSLSMLFTRRIGRTPQMGFLAHGAGDYADVPGATTILGAAKLTGRTRAGWNIGVLNAVTARENADVISGTNEFEQEVEPATNYFVSRISRDMKNGNLRVGGILTSVVRNFEDMDLAERLNKHSEGFGLDTEYWWKNRTFHLIAQGAFTNISGDADAVLARQRSSARYFQRPDREHGSNGLFSDAYDSTATSMRGFGSYIRMAKEGGTMRWESSLNVRSPGFENNDIGVLSRADYIWQHGNLSWRWTKPGKYHRSAGLTFGGQQQHNFDGDLTARQVHLSTWVELPFYWEVGFWGSLRPETFDDQKLRGGPVVLSPSQKNMELSLSSNRNKSIYFSVYNSLGTQADGGGYQNWGANVTWAPASNVSVSMGPSYDISKGKSQYITSVADATNTGFYGRRYIFSDIDSKGLSMDTRLNVTFTPRMSLQLFAQPYLSSNNFSNWKEFARVRDHEKRVFGRDVGTVSEVAGNNGRTITIDPDGTGPAASFNFREPDFTFRSLRGNAVFRWEYTPGSTLFLVWTQDRSSEVIEGDFNFGRDRRALFNSELSPANHVFLVKLNYWLPM